MRMSTSTTASSRITVIQSAAAELRLEPARAFVEQHARQRDVLIVAASRGAADDFARAIAAHSGASIGLHRFSLTELAARIAAPVLAAQGVAPSSPLGREAVAARAAFDARSAGALSYFGAVAATPGFSRALARTVGELRLAGIGARQLRALPLGGADLADLLDSIRRAVPRGIRDGFERRSSRRQPMRSPTRRTSIGTARCCSSTSLLIPTPNSRSSGRLSLLSCDPCSSRSRLGTSPL